MRQVVRGAAAALGLAIVADGADPSTYRPHEAFLESAEFPKGTAQECKDAVNSIVMQRQSYAKFVEDLRAARNQCDHSVAVKTAVRWTWKGENIGADSAYRCPSGTKYEGYLLMNTEPDHQLQTDSLRFFALVNSGGCKPSDDEKAVVILNSDHTKICSGDGDELRLEVSEVTPGAMAIWENNPPPFVLFDVRNCANAPSEVITDTTNTFYGALGITTTEEATTTTEAATTTEGGCGGDDNN